MLLASQLHQNFFLVYRKTISRRVRGLSRVMLNLQPFYWRSAMQLPKSLKSRLLPTIVFVLTLLSAFCSPAAASNDLETLKKEVDALNRKIEKMEKEGSWVKGDVDELSTRMDNAEMHTATDKLSLGVEFRTQANNIHYNDLRMAPPMMIGAFFTPPPNGFNGATLNQIQSAVGGMIMTGNVPAPTAYDADNDIIYTNKFRLNMKGSVNPYLRFDGRLSAYKVFGDSTGVKFNQGSMGDINFDGTTSSLPNGDILHLERAYFTLSHEYNDVPVSFSLGRRPATDGPPLEYGNYSLVGGSPVATIINWQFDGASLSFGLENVTGIPGASFKICYGVGFESDWGNSTSLNYMTSDIKDVHLLGFISDLYDNGNTSLMLNYARAWDITDGFTGLTVMPFIVSRADTNGDGESEYYFEPNSGAFISRLEPQTNIGDWDAASLLLRTNMKPYLADIDFFLGGSWTHTDPSRISGNPFFEIMGMGLLSSNGDLKSRDGYSIYTGALFPMPMHARLGLEYNMGSKYWFNFTGAEDSLVGSKLAARGDVYEAYYIQPLFDRHFFVKLGSRFYDYRYTGSGNPLGKPVSISQANALDAINPVVDQVWDNYLSATVRF